MSDKKITKKIQYDVMRDIRRQLVWIKNAIDENDLETLNQLALQLAATAGNLETERLQEIANGK
jgi:plasmid maintenance system killer protein